MSGESESALERLFTSPRFLALSGLIIQAMIAVRVQVARPPLWKVLFGLAVAWGIIGMGYWNYRDDLDRIEQRKQPGGAE